MTQQKEREKITTEEIDLRNSRTSDDLNSQKSKSTKKITAKASIIASIIGMLPVLAVGGATYYIANRSIEEQITRAEQTGRQTQLTTEIQQQKQLLTTTIAIATGGITLLAGGLIGLWTRRSLKQATDAVKRANRFSGERAKEERSQILTETIQNIRNSLQEKDILEATVEEVKRILECDRVVIYSREEGSRGVVIAEAVDPRWPRALNRTIVDPCFDARYDEKYQNGRVRALDNIYKSGISQCYIDQLKKLAVKANLVAPVLNEGKLLGLLVAHQCDEPRIWQQWEVDLAAQIAVQVGFAVDNARVLEKSAKMEQQLANEAQWTKFFTDSIQHIRASLKEKEVLKAVVKEVRGILNCDRVLVYSLEEQTKGKVIAESVAPRWPRALGRVIVDPCFDASYSEKYQNGRVRALNNIREANMTSCYVELLEKLEVKANLVSPILNEGKLLGLLVAHQCSEPRSWQELEIRWIAQIAAQVGFAIDNARALAGFDRMEEKARTEAEWTEFFTDVVGHIRASLKEEDILETAVEEVQKIIRCDRAVVYSLEAKTKGKVIAESVDPRWPRILGTVIVDPCFDASYSEKYRNGRVRALDNIRESKITPCYLEQLEKIAVKANLVAPILNEGKLLGLLVAHQCSQPRKWQELEIRWMAQIAAQIGFAIDNARVLATSASVEKQAKTESQWTEFFTDVVRLIRLSLKEEDILATTVSEVQKIIGCDRVVVYSLEAKTKGEVIAESVDPRWPRILGRVIVDPCFDASYSEKYQNGRVRALDNISESDMTPCYVEQLEKIAVKANLVAPILNEGKLIGLLVAHQCSQPRKWQELEIRWMSQIAAQVGFAIDNARVLANYAEIQKQIEENVSQQAVVMTGDSHLLAAQLPQLFADSEIAVDDFTEDIRRQREAIMAVSEQIQEVAESAKEILTSVERVEIKGLLDVKKLEPIDRNIEEIVACKTAIKQTAERVKNLRHFFTQVSEVEILINDLTARINEQSINTIVEVGRGEEADRDSIVSMADLIYSSTQQLSTITGDIKPLMGEIETEVNEITTTIDNLNKQALNATELLKQTKEELAEIASQKDRTLASIEQIAQIASNSAATSTSANGAIEELADLARITAERSLIVADYLDKLESVARGMEVDLVEPPKS